MKEIKWGNTGWAREKVPGTTDCWRGGSSAKP